MELISPELVLIDPELAQKARALLPPPRDCLAVATATLTKAVQGDVPRPSLLVALVTLMVVTLVGTPSASARHQGSQVVTSPVAPVHASARGI